MSPTYSIYNNLCLQVHNLTAPNVLHNTQPLDISSTSSPLPQLQDINTSPILPPVLLLSPPPSRITRTTQQAKKGKAKASQTQNKHEQTNLAQTAPHFDLDI